MFLSEDIQKCRRLWSADGALCGLYEFFFVCLTVTGLFSELSNIVQRTPYATGFLEYGSNNVFGDLIWLGPTGDWLGTEEREILHIHTHNHKLRALWSSLLCNHFSPDALALWWVLMMIELMATICGTHRFVQTLTHTYGMHAFI